MFEGILGSKDEEYEKVGKIGNYDVNEDNYTYGRPHLDGFRPKLGYKIRNNKIKEEKLFFPDKKGVMLTDDEYKEIKQSKIDNPSRPFGIKKKEKTIGEYLEEKGIQIEITLEDDDGRIMTPYKSGEFVKNVVPAKKFFITINPCSKAEIRR